MEWMELFGGTSQQAVIFDQVGDPLMPQDENSEPQDDNANSQQDSGGRPGRGYGG